MNHSRKFAFDVGLTFVASTAAIVLGFVISILLGRFLGTYDLGLYKMVSVIYGVLLLFATFGISATVTKFVAEQKGNRIGMNLIASSAMILSVVMGCCFATIFYMSSDALEVFFGIDGLAELVRILAPIFPFALSNGVLLGILNGIREMKKFAVATIIQSVLMVSLSACMISTGEGVRGVILSTLFSSVVSLLYLLIVCRTYFDLTLVGLRATTREILTFSSKVFGANAVNLVNYQGDLLLVGFFLTASDVGLYGVAIGLGRFFWVIPQAVQTITYPAISERWCRGDRASVKKIVDKSTKFTALALLPIGLVVGFFGREIVGMMFGSGFEGAVLPLQILLIGTVVNGVMQRPIGSILFSLNLPGLNLKIFSIAATVNVVLNLVLIPTFGIAGAAMARSVSFIMITILILGCLRSVSDARVDGLWFGKLWLSAMACILCHFVLLNLGCAPVSIVLVVGLTLLIWYRFMQPDDRDRILTVSRDVAGRFIKMKR